MAKYGKFEECPFCQIEGCDYDKLIEKEKKQLSLWKQPVTYLAFASGVLLGLGIYWLIKRKNKK